jgi:hypothetical protein
MFDFGLTRADIRNLEKLSDPTIVRRIGRHLRFNDRNDVVEYMKTWADVLSEQQAHELADSVQMIDMIGSTVPRVTA